MSFTGWVGRSGSSAGVCCTVTGHHVPQRRRPKRCLMSHQHNFYTGKTYQAICLYIQLVYFHKEIEFHIYNPTARSCMKISLLPAQSTPQSRRKALSYLKSSLISRTVAWNGMFRTKILEVVCFLTVCFFRDDFTVGLWSQEKGQVRTSLQQNTHRVPAPPKLGMQKYQPAGSQTSSLATIKISYSTPRRDVFKWFKSYIWISEFQACWLQPQLRSGSTKSCPFNCQENILFDILKINSLI